MPILYLMLGYPGAGKTTTAKIIASLTNATLLSSDELRAQMFPSPTFSLAEHAALYKALNEQTEQLLQTGKSVIYDANLNRYEHRQEKYDISTRTGARPLLIWLNTPRVLAKERAQHISRQHLWPPNENPDTMFERIAKVIEPPHSDEPTIELDGAHATAQTVKELLEQNKAL